jgi:hypothetical protein
MAMERWLCTKKRQYTGEVEFAQAQGGGTFPVTPLLVLKSYTKANIGNSGSRAK